MSLETLPRNKSADQKQLVLENELDGVRNKLGQLSYITYASRPDLSAKVGELASAINKFTYEHVGTLNSVIDHANATCSEIGFVFNGSMNLDSAHFVLFVDGALGGSEGNSRLGTLLAVTDKFPSGLSHLVGWESKR